MNDDQPKIDLTKPVTMSFNIDELLARDREKNPDAWALHEEMMRGMRKPKPKAERWVEGCKEYGRCGECGNIIRWNKPFFGSMHLCA